MFHIIGTMAEFERDIIQERTQAGLEAARARGRMGGRSKVTDRIPAKTLARAKELYLSREHTVEEILRITGLKRGSFYKYVVDTQKGKDGNAVKLA